MLKKTIIALLALVIAVLLVAPATANAQVVVGVGVGRVFPRPYGYVAVRPGPYVVAPAPYVAVSPGYVYPGPVVVGGRWCARPYAYHYRGYEVRHPYGWRR
ncbi:MAG: hypothetical protein ABR866_15265 [Candidatus Korobacteraceae bacterium]|jgi:hypothetical protein